MAGITRHWTLRHIHGIGSPKWAEQVEMRLRAGYGAEDVAVWLECSVIHVRELVKTLRQAGRLAEWWPV